MLKDQALHQWIDGISLPTDYSAFLLTLTESELVNPTVLIYSLGEIVERNETYEVKEYCPGYLAIGDDSGGSAIVLSLSTGEIGTVDHGSMTPKDIHALAANFAEWRRSGFRIDEKA